MSMSTEVQALLGRADRSDRQAARVGSPGGALAGPAVIQVLG